MDYKKLWLELIKRLSLWEWGESILSTSLVNEMVQMELKQAREEEKDE